MGRTFNSKDDYNEIFIASSDQTGSVLFTIPPYVTQREFQVELAVYSANEKVTRTFNVTLAPFNGDRIPLETDVRRFTASSVISIIIQSLFFPIDFPFILPFAQSITYA